MPTYLMKEAPDVDFYIAWSTVVEAPVGGGTRAEMAQERDYTEERLVHCDETGTSVLWQVDGYPIEGSWEDGGAIYMQRGVVSSRAAMFTLTRRLIEDEKLDVTDLLVPFDDEAEVRPA